MEQNLNIWLWVKTNGTMSGVGAPPILVDFLGDWDVHWGYNLDFAHDHTVFGVTPRLGRGFFLAQRPWQEAPRHQKALECRRV